MNLRGYWLLTITPDPSENALTSKSLASRLEALGLPIDHPRLEREVQAHPYQYYHLSYHTADDIQVVIQTRRSHVRGDGSYFFTYVPSTRRLQPLP